jgi:hypothetical protein
MKARVARLYFRRHPWLGDLFREWGYEFRDSWLQERLHFIAFKPFRSLDLDASFPTEENRCCLHHGGPLESSMHAFVMFHYVGPPTEAPWDRATKPFFKHLGRVREGRPLIQELRSICNQRSSDDYALRPDAIVVRFQLKSAHLGILNAAVEVYLIPESWEPPVAPAKSKRAKKP